MQQRDLVQSPPSQAQELCAQADIVLGGGGPAPAVRCPSSLQDHAGSQVLSGSTPEEQSYLHAAQSALCSKHCAPGAWQHLVALQSSPSTEHCSGTQGAAPCVQGPSVLQLHQLLSTSDKSGASGVHWDLQVAQPSTFSKHCVFGWLQHCVLLQSSPGSEHLTISPSARSPKALQVHHCPSQCDGFGPGTQLSRHWAYLVMLFCS